MILTSIFLQAAVNLPDATAPHNTTIAETLLHQLATGWYIYVPQLFMSVLSVYIIIDRWIATKRALKGEANFLPKIKDFIYAGKIDIQRFGQKHGYTRGQHHPQRIEQNWKTCE